MSGRGTIVVVAPDVDFRRSLCFALQTEGYMVKAFSNLFAAMDEIGEARCSLVDAKVLRSEAAIWKSLGRARNKTILLTSGIRSVQKFGAAAELITPFTGSDLVKTLANMPAGGT